MNRMYPYLLCLLFAVAGPFFPLAHAEESLPDRASLPEIASVSETTNPEVHNAIQMAQEEVRDPFAKALPEELENLPVLEAPEALPAVNIELQGIGLGSKNAYAIIGGEIFFRGETKNGIKLIEVRKREVDILVNGGKITVPLFDEMDLQRAKARAHQKGTLKRSSVEPTPEM